MLTLILLGMVVGYLLVVSILVVRLPKIIKWTLWRWAARVILLLVLLPLPFIDEIIGLRHFKHLCDAQGGLRVYQAVELGPQYYNEDGSPKFINEKGELDESIFNGRYKFRRRSIDDIATKWVRISKWTDSITDNNTGKVLGTYSIFFYFGGWLANNFSYATGGRHCQGYGYQTTYDGFIKHVLISAFTQEGAPR